ncbi:DUF4176 domain-containing protein [Bacillus sp. FJAT-49705]|uniref:DUF4176 domain-containing protein n=1 Tax=Cytobacillus citreus TaxID=2833586 RepID=A0ABS5NPB9_9BACI|nr:DUF4176 domain-containing protein [Cytobacillus citreus]
MLDNNETLLPIGSVVILKEGTKKLLIYGRKQLLLKEDGPKMYDYVSCFYPEGHINADYTFVFNQADIHEVIFKGYVDEDESKFVSEILGD